MDVFLKDGNVCGGRWEIQGCPLICIKEQTVVIIRKTTHKKNIPVKHYSVFWLKLLSNLSECESVSASEDVLQTPS